MWLVPIDALLFTLIVESYQTMFSLETEKASTALLFTLIVESYQTMFFIRN